MFHADKDEHRIISSEIPQSLELLKKLAASYTEAVDKTRVATKAAESEVVKYVKELVEKAKQQGTIPTHSPPGVSARTESIRGSTS